MNVTIFARNTGQARVVTLPLLPHSGAPAVCNTNVTFVEPNGSMTGSLFPTGTHKDMLLVPCPETGTQFEVESTLIDSVNRLSWYLSRQCLHCTRTKAPRASTREISLNRSAVRAPFGWA